MSKKKLLIIGLDGATFDLILPWVKNGELPLFDKLIKSGTSGDLKTVFGRTYYVFRNIQSFTSWTSFATGMLPTRHGIYSVFKGKGLVNSLAIKGERVWNVLSKNGFKVGVINIPVTYPPHQVNGFIVSGLLTPPESKNFTYPKDLGKELKNYRVSFKEKNYPDVKHAEFLKDVRDVFEKRRDAVLRLMKEKEWDFFIVNFSLLDELQHFFWHFMDKSHPQYDEKFESIYGNVIIDAYKDMEKVITEMIKRAGKNTIIFIISDHGFGSKFKEFDFRSELKKTICLKLGIIKKDAKVANHKPNGIFIAIGPDIKNNFKINGANLIDIAPTALFMFGIHIPINIDGKVLKGIFKDDSEYANTKVEFDKNSKNQIVERIKSIIYRFVYRLTLM